VTYAAEECDKLDNAALRGCLRLFLRGFGLWVKRSELNRCVHINNFLLSTNLYPDWDGTGIGELHRRSLNENPTHAIVFRSLTRALNGPIINQLLNLGYRLIPTRRVWLFDSANKEAIIRRRGFPIRLARGIPGNGLRMGGGTLSDVIFGKIFPS
jgi:hypothetical protein